MKEKIIKTIIGAASLALVWYLLYFGDRHNYMNGLMVAVLGYVGFIMFINGVIPMIFESDTKIMDKDVIDVDFSYWNEKGILGKNLVENKICVIDKASDPNKVKGGQVWRCRITKKFKTYYVVKPEKLLREI